jgi:poly(A) polymerase
MSDTIRLSPERAPWLGSGPLKKILSVLDADGDEARIVGGAVRNTLLGIPPGDFDIATTAKPGEVMKRAQAAGFHAVPTGIEHGTVTIVVNDRPFEVTTLREDVETDGRHATVKFGRDWKRDAERRDFTINALFLTRHLDVIDFTGGLADIEARRVRFIGDAGRRIAEDYLRVLRFFRFHAAYGEGPMDAEGLAACIQAKPHLGQLSRERVRVELLKLLAAKHAVPVLASMNETGILLDVLGGVPWLASLSNLMKEEAQLGLEPSPVRRLGALALRTREDADRLRERLRLTNEEHRRLRGMVENWWRVSPREGEAAVKALLYRVGPDLFVDRALLAFSRAEEKVDDAGWRVLIALPSRWTAPKFPLASKDFTALGVEKGPALGAALAKAEELWVEAGFPEEKDALSSLADRAIKSSK